MYYRYTVTEKYYTKLRNYMEMNVSVLCAFTYYSYLEINSFYFSYYYKINFILFTENLYHN